VLSAISYYHKAAETERATNHLTGRQERHSRLQVYLEKVGNGSTIGEMQKSGIY